MQIGVIGSNKSQCSDDLYQFAYEVGLLLGKKGHTVINGGMQGVMEAVSKGVKESQNTESKVVGILPFNNSDGCNDYLDVKIPTGIGFARNSVIALSSDILIALGGGAGTLSEISFAWQYGKKVFCYMDVRGWSQNLANIDLDNRKSDLLVGFQSMEELSKLIDNEGNIDVS
jgi:uncharacterized protein (TIGR00725 family)